MTDQEIDRILSAEPRIAPSSGFVRSVMEDVYRESSSAPPLKFPWLRALPMLVAWAVALVFLLTASGHQFSRTSLSPLIAAASQAVSKYGVVWIEAALLVSLLTATLSMKFAERKRQ